MRTEGAKGRNGATFFEALALEKIHALFSGGQAKDWHSDP